MTSAPLLKNLQRRVWDGSIPLEVRLASSECRTFEDSSPYLIQCPRLMYIPLLLPRIHNFFSASLINPDVGFNDGWFSFDEVPLKWHYPIGLLYDLYSGNEPFAAGDRAQEIQAPTALEDQPSQPRSSQAVQTWKLTVHFTAWPEQQLVKLDDEARYFHDTFMNSVKEADFLRNGSGKVILSLSREDSTQLWEAVQNHDLSLFDPIYQRLIYPPGVTLRHVPIKFYLPAAAEPNSIAETPSTGSVRVVQSPTSTMVSSRQPQTIGTALNTLLPTLFPSRRRCLLAEPVLHGAIVPMNAPIEELMKGAAYADGWLHIVIVMMG